MDPRDQWTAKQMTWIRARVPMNFPWTKREPVIHGCISLPSPPFLFYSLLHYNSSSTPPPPTHPPTKTRHTIFLFIHSPGCLASQKEPKAVVVLKLKSLTRRCHSAVPLRCFPIMWDFWFERQQFIFQCVGFHSTPSPSSRCPIAADQERSRAIGLIYPLCSGSKQQ